MSRASRDKGKRGERLFRDELREAGYLKARRAQQYAGGTDSADIVCEELARFHFEVKFVERLNTRSAIAQATRDAGEKLPVVAHKTSRADWMIYMPARVLFAILRGDHLDTPLRGHGGQPSAPAPRKTPAEGESAAPVESPRASSQQP